MNIALKNLRPGDEYPGGSINSRKYSPAEVNDMADQLLAHGHLQSLLVRTSPKEDGTFYVIAGNRRLAALRQLEKKKLLAKIPAFDPEAVAAIVRDDLERGDALAKSLVENVARVPLHPVDRFNVFARMHAGGMTADQIATSMMTTPRIVNQALALSALSAKARDAYLADKITGRQAEALTVTTDHAAQDRALKQIHDHTRAVDIKRMLVGDADLMGPLLKFVGEDAYAKAGGKLHKDLFNETEGGAPTVLSPDLLIKLAAQKLTPTVAQLKADGWKWAAPPMEFGRRDWKYWPKAQGGKNCSPANKKTTGVVIGFTKNGDLDMTYGVLHGDDGYSLRDNASKPKKKKEKAKPGGKPIVSAALMRDMSQWLTEAAAGALVAHSEIKLLHALILAGANGAGYSKAVDIKVGGLHGKLLNSSRTYRENNLPFEKLFAELMKSGGPAETKRVTLLAEMVARSFDFQVFRGDKSPLKDPAYAAVVNAMHTPDLLDELTEQLTKNAERYFVGAGKRANIEAIKESLGADTARQISKGTGKAIAAFAAQNVPETGWLPEAMRPAGYKPPKPSAAAMKCRHCGCNEDNACEGGCSWKEPGLCDNPVCLAKDAKAKAKPAKKLK